MIFLLWNYRGLGRPATIRSLREYSLSNRPDVIFLSETKLSDEKRVTTVASILGFTKFHFLPSTGKSGGLLLLWKDNIDINVVVANEFLLNCIFLNDDRVTGEPWQFTFVYGPPVPSLKPLFWDELLKVGETFMGPWIVAGDFNAILHQSDKLGGRPVAHSSRDGFHDMVHRNGLIDLGFSGNPFTWNNKRWVKLISVNDWIGGLQTVNGVYYIQPLMYLIYRPLSLIILLSSSLPIQTHVLNLNRSVLKLCG